jgi:hypothetical protein
MKAVCWYLPTSPNDVTTLKTNTENFTPMRTLNLIRYYLMDFQNSLRKITDRSPGQEFHSGLHEYEAGVLNYKCNIQCVAETERID